MDIISAIVTSNPVVISKNFQSVKDAVFININQKVTIQGTLLCYEKFDNVILTDVSRIVLN